MAARTLTKWLAASLIACTAAVPTLDKKEIVARANTTCAGGVHIFVTHGHGAAINQIGPLSSTLNDIKAAIPNSTYLLTPYYQQPQNYLNFIFEIDPATELLKNNITSYVAACPNVPIVLLGYSEGAIITMNALCGSSSAGFLPTVPLNSTYAPHIIASVVYGDESRAIGQPYNLGSCETFGILPRLYPQGCANFESNIQSYCDSADPLCCIGGTNFDAHHAYFGIYDKNVTKYVTAQYKAFRAQKPS